MSLRVNSPPNVPQAGSHFRNSEVNPIGVSYKSIVGLGTILSQLLMGQTEAKVRHARYGLDGYTTQTLFGNPLKANVKSPTQRAHATSPHNGGRNRRGTIRYKRKCSRGGGPL